MEIVLDLRPVGDREAERMEQAFDPLQRARHRVQPANADAATGQRDIERVCGELLLELRVGKLAAAALQRGFQRRLGLVDARARRGPLRRRQLAQRLQKLRQGPALPEIARLAVFQRSGVGAGCEFSLRCGDDGFEVLHGCSAGNPVEKKGRRLSPPSCVRYAQAREALACSAILLNAVLSWTARSASTLRSISIDAFLSPLMNTL